MTAMEVTGPMEIQSLESILNPVKRRIAASPWRRWRNRWRASERTKNKDRNPSMAITFEPYASKGSRVIESTAGTESSANTMSVVSMTSSATNNGVATNRPCSRRQK